MDRWKFQQMVPFALSDQDWERIELVFMSIEGIGTTERMSEIVSNGMGYVDVLYDAVIERRKLIETIGDLKREVSKAQAENQQLREFRSRIIEAYKDMEHPDPRPNRVE